MDALKGRFGGSVKAMRSDWGEAVHEMGLAWDGFLERVAKSDFAQAGARFGRDVLKGWTGWLTPSPAEDPNLKRMRELDREMNRLGGWLATELENGESGPAVDKARERLRQLQDEYFKLAEAVEAARKAQSDFDFGQNYRTGGTGKGSGPATGMTADEQKRVNELWAAYDKEAAAMRGTAAERTIRLAGLAAETSALEVGRTAAAAYEERLVAEQRQILMLNVAYADWRKEMQDAISDDNELCVTDADLSMFMEAMQ